MLIVKIVLSIVLRELDNWILPKERLVKVKGTNRVALQKLNDDSLTYKTIGLFPTLKHAEEAKENREHAMRLFKPYSSIEDFLSRFTLLKIGPLHIRLHKITDEDRTTLYHNHPFHYLSIILKGGYSEKIIRDGKIEEATHSTGSFILRSCETFHRISSIRKPTYTLFFAWGDYGWQAFNPTPDNSKDGLHQREISGVSVWCKREAGIWFIGNKSKQVAAKETRHSIHQM